MKYGVCCVLNSRNTTLAPQRYTFYKLNFEIEILLLRYSIKSQLIFQTIDFQAPHGNKTLLHVMAKQVVDIKKNNVTLSKKANIGGMFL